MEDINTARSGSGYLITYAACPVVWASKMQTGIALSTTEAEYISLSKAIREVIPFIDLFTELKQKVDPDITNLSYYSHLTMRRNNFYRIGFSFSFPVLVCT
jgi:hypothetical protein